MPRYIPYVPKKEEKRYIAAKPAEKGNYISFDFNRDAQDTSPNYENASAGQNSSPLPSKYVSWQGNANVANNSQQIIASPTYRIEQQVQFNPPALRGVDYPEWYQGLVDNTCIVITALRAGNNLKCKVHLGLPWDNNKQDTGVINFRNIDDKYAEAATTFYSPTSYENSHHMNPMHNHLWPNKLDKNIFDNVSIIRVGENNDPPLAIKKVSITLNNQIICDHEFSPVVFVKKELLLSPYIWDHRQSYIEYSSNPVLPIAAGEIGKSWHPSYGTTSDWTKTFSVFNENPGHWCDDFADWVIREAVLQGKVRFPVDEFGPYPPPNCSYLTCRWFDPKGLFHHPYNTKWEHLGEIVKPGFLAPPVYHGAFFNFWVRPRFLESHSNYQHLTDNGTEEEIKNRIVDIVENEKPTEYHPDSFHPERDINWYCMLSGNDNKRVKLGVAALVRLRNKNDSLLKYCRIDNNGKIMLWWDNDNKKEYWELDWVGETFYFFYWCRSGFGRTDGRKLGFPFIIRNQ